MTQVFINPGSGPVEGATREVADDSMVAFMFDLGLEDAIYAYRGPGFDHRGNLDGRFDYRIHWHGRWVDVSMPGVALEVLKAREGFPPRLYVDGSSWYWPLALSTVRDELTGVEAP